MIFEAFGATGVTLKEGSLQSIIDSSSDLSELKVVEDIDKIEGTLSEIYIKYDNPIVFIRDNTGIIQIEKISNTFIITDHAFKPEAPWPSN